MKRINFVFNKICDIDNIIEAIYNSSGGKTHREDVQRILANPEKYAKKIQQKLLKGEFKPSYSKPREVNDGVKLKKRKVCEPDYYPDQIIHWSVCQVIFPKLMDMIPKTSCGSISGRGQIYTKKLVEKWLKHDPKGMKYCLKLDISKCYDNINHKVLFKLFKRKYKDKRFLELIKILIKNYHSSVSNHNGIPIGWVTSQIFSMFMLTEIDNYLTHANKFDKDKSVALGNLRCYISHIVRYMDDICIYSNNKKGLHKVFKKLQIFAKKYLDLTIKENQQVFKVYRYNKHKNKYVGRKIDFVGFTMGFCPTGIRKSISLRILQCSRKLRKGKYSLKNCMSYLSYYGWIKYSRADKFFKEYVRGLSRKFIKAIVRQGMKNKNYKMNMYIDEFIQSKKSKIRSFTRLMMMCDLLKLSRTT